MPCLAVASTTEHKRSCTLKVIYDIAITQKYLHMHTSLSLSVSLTLSLSLSLSVSLSLSLCLSLSLSLSLSVSQIWKVAFMFTLADVFVASLFALSICIIFVGVMINYSPLLYLWREVCKLPSRICWSWLRSCSLSPGCHHGWLGVKNLSIA